jgi:hypothetical protein
MDFYYFPLHTSFSFGKQIYSKGKSPVGDLGVHSGYVTLDVDCKGWGDGVYLVNLQSEKESLSCKFVKN